MELTEIAAGYDLLAELLLYPEERDAARVEAGQQALRETPAAVAEPVARFLAAPEAERCEEYLQILELAAPCPLYVGAYLFDEPTNCRGAGVSGRNRYMIELVNIYRHFGLEGTGGELPDFLPLMIDFLRLSLTRLHLDRDGLRRCFVERYLLPGLPPLRERLGRYESAYAALVEALEALLHQDLERTAEPAASSKGRRLPRASETDAGVKEA